MFALDAAAAALPGVLGVAVAGTAWLRLGRTRRELAAARYAAHHDPTTGLLNRAGLADQWPRLAPVRSVLLVDLDGFKPVNDRHGHAAGDQVLTAVAERLARRVPGAVARLGGDEFAAVTTSPDPCAVARSVVRAVAAPVTLPDGTTVAVTASVGVAPDPAGSLAEALAAADAAMYRAKFAGTGVAVFDPRRDDRPSVAADPRPAPRVRDLSVPRRAWEVAR